MRLSKFLEINPYAGIGYFGRWTRAELNTLSEPPWKELQRLNRSGDKLAFRAYMARREGGWKAAVNCIMADHGRPNRY
jgi:hypothetical protein